MQVGVRNMVGWIPAHAIPVVSQNMPVFELACIHNGKKIN